MKNYKEIINARKILEDYNTKDLFEDKELGDSIENKWKRYYGKGWYGFSMQGAPASWYCIIDKFLNQLNEIDPKFEIHQIKIKFGGMRIYLGFSEIINKDNSILSYINQQISILEHELFHENLIY